MVAAVGRAVDGLEAGQVADAVLVLGLAAASRIGADLGCQARTAAQASQRNSSSSAAACSSSTSAATSSSAASSAAAAAQHGRRTGITSDGCNETCDGNQRQSERDLHLNGVDFVCTTMECVCCMGNVGGACRLYGLC
ncbi:hypothetical protein GQ42DRAFT_4723 [Ramicandelaber brevisporus]|nr:hypothetical protein GQ42DRAFT_4723 [Ramicandelaber brevisporus]